MWNRVVKYGEVPEWSNGAVSVTRLALLPSEVQILSFPTMKKKIRIKQLRDLIRNWDQLSMNNPNNIHNLSTSQRQDWVDELNNLLSENNNN